MTGRPRNPDPDTEPSLIAGSDREPRENGTREATARRQQWRRPQLLPMPEKRPGVEFRYIRTSSLGQQDNTNVSSKFREGWEPVKAADFPELKVITDHGSRFPENIERGGLLLCMNAAETMQERREYQAAFAKQQMEAVDNHYMRQSDPRMPMLKPERHTRHDRFGADE